MKQRINGEFIRKVASTDRRYAFKYLLMLDDKGELRDKRLEEIASYIRKHGTTLENEVSIIYRRLPQYWRVIFDIIKDNY